MRVCVCVCVCSCVCVFMCFYDCFGCQFVSFYGYLIVCLSVRLFVFLSPCLFVSWSYSLLVYVSVCLFVCLLACVILCVCVCLCICLCVCTFVCVCLSGQFGPACCLANSLRWNSRKLRFVRRTVCAHSSRKLCNRGRPSQVVFSRWHFRSKDV